MTAVALTKACHRFAEIAAPYLYIMDDEHHAEALELIETRLLKMRKILRMIRSMRLSKCLSMP